MRQAWDPLLQRCNACTWTNVSSSYKIQVNYKGLKITVCVHSWGKFWTKDTKRPKKAQLPLLKSREQKQGVGSKSGVLRMPPALNTTKWWAEHLSHPSGPTPGPIPTYPHPIQGTSLPPSARELVACSHSPLLQQGP